MTAEEDDLQIPEFLRRKPGEKKTELPAPDAPRVWAPIKSVSEVRRTERRPIFCSNPQFEVQVNLENGGNPTKIALYDDWAEFLKEHNFDAHPIKKMGEVGETTIVLVGGYIAAPVAPGMAPTIRSRSKKISDVRDHIWARANQLWEAAGSPTDIKVVLKLRRDWMKIMAAEGINKFTCSSELGNWQKFKLSGK